MLKITISGGKSWKEEVCFPPADFEIPPFRSRKQSARTTKLESRPPGMRRFGQTSLSESFFSRSRCPDGDRPTTPSNKRSVSLSEFLNRKLVKTTSRSLKEKQTSFSSIGAANNESIGKKEAACGGSVLNDAVFRQFKVPAKEKEQGESAEEGERGESQLESSTLGCDGSRKRKNSFDDLSGESKRLARKTFLVLGDEPKPWPCRRGKQTMEKRGKPLYDHYANGSGWWDDGKEGVDTEEVGCNDYWEGMGSTTLGGLEWH